VNVPAPTEGSNWLFVTPVPLNSPPVVASESLFVSVVRSMFSSSTHTSSILSKLPAFAGSSSITLIVRSTESSQLPSPIV